VSDVLELAAGGDLPHGPVCALVAATAVGERLIDGDGLGLVGETVVVPEDRKRPTGFQRVERPPGWWTLCSSGVCRSNQCQASAHARLADPVFLRAPRPAAASMPRRC
jgi:hypothetical protein